MGVEQWVKSNLERNDYINNSTGGSYSKKGNCPFFIA
jgi:hypothetical protein